MTGASIQFAVDSAFSTDFGARPAEMGVQKIMIVLTDGRAQDDVKLPSQNAQENGFYSLII